MELLSETLRAIPLAVLARAIAAAALVRYILTASLPIRSHLTLTHHITATPQKIPNRPG